jgi:hypothetical protein
LCAPADDTAITDVTGGRSGTARVADEASEWRHPPPHQEKERHVKRITLIASALCFALAAFSSFAEDRMDKSDKMAKSDKMHKADKMEKSDRVAKKDKMAKHDKMDRMEKPGATQ